MSNNFLYNFLSKMLIWFLPVVLVFFSLTTNLTNADLHKSTLRNSDFYPSLSQELGGVDSQKANQGFVAVFFGTIFDNLATPGWLQNLFERNITLTTSWLDGNDKEWSFYLPTQEIEATINQKIDQKTKELAPNISVCSQVQSEKIKKEGFDLEKDMCLPKEVKDGQQSISEYLNLATTGPQRNETLNTLIKNTDLNSFTDKFKVKDLKNISDGQKSIISNLNIFRDYYLRLKSYVLPSLLLAMAMFFFLIVLAKISGKNLVKEIRGVLFYVSTSTIILVITLILIFGGITYINSLIGSILFAGFTTSNLTNLLALEFIRFLWNIFSLAIWISLGLIGLNIGIYLASITGIFEQSTVRNERLNRPKPEPTHEQEVYPHFDKEFKESPRRQAFSQATNNYEPEPIQHFDDTDSFNTPFDHFNQTAASRQNKAVNNNQPTKINNSVSTDNPDLAKIEENSLNSYFNKTQINPDYHSSETFYDSVPTQNTQTTQIPPQNYNQTSTQIPLQPQTPAQTYNQNPTQIPNSATVIPPVSTPKPINKPNIREDTEQDY